MGGHVGRVGRCHAGDQVAGLVAGVGQVQSAHLHLDARLDQALQHLLGGHVFGFELGQLFANQGDVTRSVAQQHAHGSFLRCGLAGQYQTSTLGHGLAAVDVDE